MNAKLLNKGNPTSRGFTLIELLVVIVIIAIISGLGFAGVNAAMQHGRKSREIGAAKALISAYQAYPTDNGGELMPGNDRRVNSVEMPNGNSVSGPAANRYPYRLASYMDYKIEGTILVNKNATQVDSSSTYLVSLYPAMGINYQCVGGDMGMDGKVTMADTLTSNAQASSAPIVFASAGSGSAEDSIDGYTFVTPPKFPGGTWTQAPWTDESAADEYGHVSGRYNGKAVCAFLDGAVRVYSMPELQDMRLWSAAAAVADDPDYVPQRQGGGGGR